MEVTKLEHACQVLTRDGARLVLDPGNFTRPVDVTGVEGIVVTHAHPDHVTPEQVRRILDVNPRAVVIGPAGVATALAGAGVTVDVVTDGDARTVGPFELTFHGTRHNVIHASVPVIDNTGVLVDGRLFHPGDAYTVPPVPVEVLAAPIGAPWLKIGELMDWVAAVGPRRAYPIHEATLSAVGLDMHVARLREVVEPGGEVTVIAPGDTVTV